MPGRQSRQSRPPRRTRRERIAAAVAEEVGLVVDGNTVRTAQAADAIQPSSIAGREFELTSTAEDVREFLKKAAPHMERQGDSIILPNDSSMPDEITSEFEEVRSVAEGGRAFSMTASQRAAFPKSEYPTLLSIKRHQVEMFARAYGHIYADCWEQQLKTSAHHLPVDDPLRDSEKVTEYKKSVRERCAIQFYQGVRFTPKASAKGSSPEQLVMSFADAAMAMVYETHLGHLGPRAPIDECILREFLAVELRHALSDDVEKSQNYQWPAGSKPSIGRKVAGIASELRAGARLPRAIGDSNNKGTVLLEGSPKFYVHVGGALFARRAGFCAAQRTCQQQYERSLWVEMHGVAAGPKFDEKSAKPGWLFRKSAGLFHVRLMVKTPPNPNDSDIYTIHFACVKTAMIFFTTQLRTGPMASMQTAVRKERVNAELRLAQLRVPSLRLCSNCKKPHRNRATGRWVWTGLCNTFRCEGCVLPEDAPPEAADEELPEQAVGRYCGEACQRAAWSRQHATMVECVIDRWQSSSEDPPPINGHTTVPHKKQCPRFDLLGDFPESTAEHRRRMARARAKGDAKDEASPEAKLEEERADRLVRAFVKRDPEKAAAEQPEGVGGRPEGFRVHNAYILFTIDFLKKIKEDGAMHKAMMDRYGWDGVTRGAYPPDPSAVTLLSVMCEEYQLLREATDDESKARLDKYKERAALQKAEVNSAFERYKELLKTDPEKAAAFQQERVERQSRVER